MSTDIEQRVRAGLADAPTPPGLQLDADAVTRLASRRHRHRRTGQALAGGMTSLAVLGAVTWAGGWLPGEVQRALPASPWSACPISGSVSGEQSVQLEAVDHATIPLSHGGALVAGLAMGCADGDHLFMSTTTEPVEALPDTVPRQFAIGSDSDEEHLSSALGGLRLEDGREVTGVLMPRGAKDLVLVGPETVLELSSPPVRVPGTRTDAAVIEGYWPSGEDLAQVWRGADGLVHTVWSAGIASRVWQGSDPAAELTDTWVGQDRQAQQWVMRGGVVEGPFSVSTEPYAVAFPTRDPATVEVVVVVPESGGELRLEDGSALTTLWLDSREGEPMLHAAVATMEDLTPGEPLPDLAWVADVDDEPQPVAVVEP